MELLFAWWHGEYGLLLLVSGAGYFARVNYSSNLAKVNKTYLGIKCWEPFREGDWFRRNIGREVNIFTRLGPSF